MRPSRWSTGVLLAFFLMSGGCGSARQSVSKQRVAAPEAMAFWDAKNGLIGGKQEPRTCGRTISITDDGGISFHSLKRTAGSVDWIETAGHSDAWAGVSPCRGASKPAHPSVLMTTDRGRHWQAMRATHLSPSFADARHGLAFEEQTLGNRARLFATRNGGRSWSPTSSPCEESFGIVSFASPKRAWALCTSQPGVGAEGKSVFESRDGGARWRELVNVTIDDRNGDGGISALGYAGPISFSPSGFGIMLEGGPGSAYVTRDGGRRWQPAPLERPAVDSGMQASAVSAHDGFALLIRDGTGVALERTADAGRTWQAVRSWSRTR